MLLPTTPISNRGFSLIEVLIALIVLAIGLLGLASLQMTSLQFTGDAYLRSQATVLAYEITDKMRSNIGAVNAGSYDVLDYTAANNAVSTYNACKTGSCKCEGSACTTANLVIYDLGTWYERLDRELPGSTAKRATIEGLGNREFRITIRWNERDLNREQQWVVKL